MGPLTPHYEPPKSREVLECASPLALWLGRSGRVESARGLAHSKTLARGRWFTGGAGVRGESLKPCVETYLPLYSAAGREVAERR